MESHQNSALHGGVWLIGGKRCGGVASGWLRAVAGLASGPPAEDDTEVHKVTVAAPSSGARCLEQRQMAEAERREHGESSGAVMGVER
jgi:hypothetical protein